MVKSSTVGCAILLLVGWVLVAAVNIILPCPGGAVHWALVILWRMFENISRTISLNTIWCVHCACMLIIQNVQAHTGATATVTRNRRCALHTVQGWIKGLMNDLIVMNSCPSGQMWQLISVYHRCFISWMFFVAHVIKVKICILRRCVVVVTFKCNEISRKITWNLFLSGIGC